MDQYRILQIDLLAKNQTQGRDVLLKQKIHDPIQMLVVLFLPSVLSEVPSPVSPLSAVLLRHPNRLWNLSDTAGVSHSVSECPAGVHEEIKMRLDQLQSYT